MIYFILCLLGFIFGCIVSNHFYRKKLSSIFALEAEIVVLKKKIDSSKDIIKMLLNRKKHH